MILKQAAGFGWPLENERGMGVLLQLARYKEKGWEVAIGYEWVKGKLLLYQEGRDKGKI